LSSSVFAGVFCRHGEGEVAEPLSRSALRSASGGIGLRDDCHHIGSLIADEAPRQEIDVRAPVYRGWSDDQLPLATLSSLR
jgi:hypothetical protein